MEQILQDMIKYKLPKRASRQFTWRSTTLLFTLAITLLFPVTLLATADVTRVNHATKQLYAGYAEDSVPFGPWWEPLHLPDNPADRTLENLEAQGYTWTDNPFLIEFILFFASTGLLAAGGIIIHVCRRRAALRSGQD